SSTGPSTGDPATIAAKSRDAAAAALHERAPSMSAIANHGSSRCTSTAPMRPSPSAARNGGAAAHKIAAATGGQARSLTRVAAHHAPSAARGSAAIHNSTIAYDGFHHVAEPSTAQRPVAGSAAPEKPTPISRQPQPRRDHSSATLDARGA